MPSRKSRVSPKKYTSYNAACTCLDPKCKMEHPGRKILKESIRLNAGPDTPATLYPCPKCKTVDLYEKRMEWAKAVSEAVEDVFFTCVIGSLPLTVIVIWMAVLYSL